MFKKIIYVYHNLGKIFSDKRFKIKKANDATIKFLRDKAVSQQDKQAVRSRRISGIAFLGLNQVGDCRFVCKSEDGERQYIQSLRFYELHKKRPKGRDEIIAMMKNSDIGVYCSDPSFLYWGAAYNATKGNYNIVVENRPPKGLSANSPKILEMQKKFVLCKHLIAVLRAAPFYWNNMVGEYARYFKVTKEDLKLAKASVEEGAEGTKEEQENMKKEKELLAQGFKEVKDKDELKEVEDKEETEGDKKDDDGERD
jgi:hypothetical protein